MSIQVLIFLLLLPSVYLVAQERSPTVYTSGESGFIAEISDEKILLEDHGNPIIKGRFALISKYGVPFIRSLDDTEAPEALFLKSEHFCLIAVGKLVTEPMINVSRRMPEIRPFGIYEFGYIRPPFSTGASSVLLEKNRVYSPSNLTRPLRDGPWVPNDRRNGIGQWLDLDFQNPYSIEENESKVKRLLIINGFVSLNRPDLYQANSRVKKIRVISIQPTFDVSFSISDTPVPQIVELPQPAKRIRIEIVEAYPGSKWTDLCISAVLGISNLERYFAP